ncbi:MAG: methionine gamma-lyase family protein, partial [Clostridia bacterium]|nr:methionine gamma-lyase family protein [Clostridia bacterium]
MNISGKIRSLCEEAESELRETFSDIDRVSGVLTEHVLDCFRKHCVSESLFAPSTGYGYGDRGRDEADGIAADIFRAEAGFIRPSILSGTHAITVALFGILRPGDVMLSVTGRPYDTLLDVIGIGDGAPGEGSLRDWGVLYDSVDLLPDGSIDIAGLREKMESYGNRLKMVYVQRSRGY